MPDEYSDSGEFLDILSRDAWVFLRESVTAALLGVDPAAGPLVDLGAGSGRGTCLLAGLAPEVTVLAVEPSPVQRAVLLARVVDDPSLRSRVTVLPTAAETVELPDRLGGVLAMNVIGHLAPPERRDLWRRVADRLAPHAPLVLNLQPPSRAEAVPDADFASVQIGRHQYVGGGGAVPDGVDSVTWHMRYRVCGEHGDAEREVTATYRWYVASPETIEAELAAVGLAADHGPYGIIRAVRAGNP